ncbi:surface layer protein [Aeropyrum camini SY1 = JCM 12091]|uniref:Surface layer protein n=1 Tax=Aeropyrum camini SY1 = JCM 12091 TaxID=1198449 RepID=U3T8T4_9CREN|nr:surface layer protein [Aeropyrum camini SY1 = JCM 12091]
MRLVNMAIAVLMVALFTLPTLLPIAQAAQDIMPTQTVDLGVRETLMIDINQIAGPSGPFLGMVGLAVVFTILGEGFDDTATLEFALVKGEVASTGDIITLKDGDPSYLTAASPINLYAENDGLKPIRGGWAENPSIETPPTVVLDDSNIDTSNVTEGWYNLVVREAGATDGIAVPFRVEDIVAGDAHPVVYTLGTLPVIDTTKFIDVDFDTLTIDIATVTVSSVDRYIPVYQPGDTVDFVVDNLPPNVDRVDIFLDWVSSPYRGSAEPFGGVYLGEIELPDELPMGIHLVIAAIYFTYAGEDWVTLTFMPIFIEPKLVNGPFIVEGVAGEDITLEITGLPMDTRIGVDFDGDDNVEAAWLVNQFVDPTVDPEDAYHLVGGPEFTSSLGSIELPVELEDSIMPLDRGAMDIYLWEEDDASTIAWEHDLEPDTEVPLDSDGDGYNDIRFVASLIASRADVPPGDVLYGDSGIAVYIDGQPLTSDTAPLDLYPCLSTITVIIFNTMARADVDIYLGPFKLGTVETNSFGVGVLEIISPPIPGVGGTTEDYTFTAVANRGSFYDNINFDSEDYVNIVPWASYEVSMGTGFYFRAGGMEWAANGTQFVISICGLEPEEVFTVDIEAENDGVTLYTDSDFGVADALGQAVYVHSAPELESIYQDITLTITGADSGVVKDSTGADFELMYRVPELLDIELYYEISSGSDVGDVGYSTVLPGDNLDPDSTSKLVIVAEDNDGIVPNLEYELLIGDEVVTFTKEDFGGGVSYEVEEKAPRRTGVYPLGIEAQGFNFLETFDRPFEDILYFLYPYYPTLVDPFNDEVFPNYDFYFLVVSDPDGSPDIIWVYPDSEEIDAGTGGVIFAAINFDSLANIYVTSPTITSPTSYPGRFDVDTDTSISVTPDPDTGVYELSETDDTGAMMFVVDEFMTPATTHTLHIFSNDPEYLETFNVVLMENWEEVEIGGGSIIEAVPLGTEVEVAIEAYGLRDRGWYKAVLLDPATLEPLTDLVFGQTFESEPFQADLEGYIGGGSYSIPTTIYLPVYTLAIVGIFDVETGELRAISDNYVLLVPASGSTTYLGGVIPVTTDEGLSIGIFPSTLIPASSMTITVSGWDPINVAGWTVTSIGIEVSFWSVDEEGEKNFEFATVGVATAFEFEGSNLVGATFRVPIPNYDDRLSGEYLIMTIDKIVVQMSEAADSDSDNITDIQFVFPIRSDYESEVFYDLGFVKASVALGNMQVLEAIAELGDDVAEVRDILLAVSDDVSTIMLQLEDMSMTLENIENGVAELLTSVGQLQASVDSLAELLQETGEEITMRLDDIDSGLAEISNGVATIQGDVATILELLESMNATLTTIQGDVAEIKTIAGTILVSVQDLQTLVADSTDAVIQAVEDNVALVLDGQAMILESLDMLDAKITSVSEGVAEIQTVLGTVSANVEDLVQANAEITGIVQENNQLLATITTSFGTLTADVSTIKDLIENGVNVKLDQVMEDLLTISDQNAQLAAQAEAIAQTLAAVQDDTSKITDIQSTLASVAGDVASVKQDTSTISSKLDDANGKLDSISSKVDSVSSAVADIQEQLGQVGDTAESASGRAQTWGIINAVLSLAVLGVAGYLVLQLTRRE